LSAFYGQLAEEKKWEVRCSDHVIVVQTAMSVGNGGEAWIGYKQDLRPCQFGLMMSIEPSFSVFYEGLSVVDYTQAVLTKIPTRPWEWTSDFLTPPEQKEVSKELKGVVVRLYCSLC
jgi:Argonaute linker 1 domain